MKLIAETAWHHQGEYEFLEQLVCGIIQHTDSDIIKLHITLDPDDYMMPDHPFYKEAKEYLFNEEEWENIVTGIHKSNKDIMLLFNDIRSIEFGMAFHPPVVEIHSVSLNDIHLLDALRQNVDPDTIITLGVGGTSIYEVDHAINYLQNPNILLMFGFQNYPTKYEDINFKKIRKIMNLFPEFQFGYADHTAWDEPNNVLITLLGAALGMDYIEKHVTTEFGVERLDWSSAVSFEMLNEIRKMMNILDTCNGDGSLKMNTAEIAYAVFGPMKKAPVLKSDAKAGQKLSKDMLCFKRTSRQSNLSQVQAIGCIDRTFRVDAKKGDVLLVEHFEN